MPEPMLITGFSEIGVLPDLGMAFARSEGGLVITSRRSDPYWSGRLTSGDLDPISGARDAVLAWIYDMAIRNMRIDWVHPRRRRPAAYSAANWTMVGDAVLADVVDLRTILVAGLQVGLILRRGDRLSIHQGDIVVHRWIAEDIVVSSTIMQALALSPMLPIGVLVPGAAVRLTDPVMRFVIVPMSWRESAAENYGPSPISFEVAEALR